MRKWDKKDVARVVKSWRRMDEDYIHREFKKEHDTYQECNSYVEGLPCKTFHDPYQFSWAEQLREHAKTIQEEFKRVALEDSEGLEKNGNNVWATAANATSAQSYGPDWKTLALMDRCVWDPINVHLFPETTRILRELGVPCLEAFFARMQPNSKIAPHSDYCNFALTAHLGLVIPEEQCWIKVGKDTREWRNGEMLMFDTSLMHEAANTADSVRYILMMRVWHPDLSPSEVDAIKYIFTCLDEPERVEGDLRMIGTLPACECLRACRCEFVFAANQYSSCPCALRLLHASLVPPHPKPLLVDTSAHHRAYDGNIGILAGQQPRICCLQRQPPLRLRTPGPRPRFDPYPLDLSRDPSTHVHA